MARDASLTDRLAARLDRGQLERVSVPGGGVAFRGETATRALDALGARAMTLDRSIIVRDDFDPSAPEDQALFAHEQHHADHGDGGGGGGGDNFADAEEVAARAVERMVLNRATAGGFEGGDAPGVGGGATAQGKADGAAVGASAQSPSNRPDDAKRDPEPASGYAAMRKQGMSHMDIVEELARRVLDATDSAQEHRNNRAADAKSTV